MMYATQSILAPRETGEWIRNPGEAAFENWFPGSAWQLTRVKPRLAGRCGTRGYARQNRDWHKNCLSSWELDFFQHPELYSSNWEDQNAAFAAI